MVAARSSHLSSTSALALVSKFKFWMGDASSKMRQRESNGDQSELCDLKPDSGMQFLLVKPDLEKVKGRQHRRSYLCWNCWNDIYYQGSGTYYLFCARKLTCILELMCREAIFSTSLSTVPYPPGVFFYTTIAYPTANNTKTGCLYLAYNYLSKYPTHLKMWQFLVNLTRLRKTSLSLPAVSAGSESHQQQREEDRGQEERLPAQRAAVSL